MNENPSSFSSSTSQPARSTLPPTPVGALESAPNQQPGEAALRRPGEHPDHEISGRLRRWALGLAVLIGCWSFTAFGQTAFLDFNTVGQYTNNFNPWNDAGGVNGGNYSFMEGPTAGVNGSGGVSVFQSIDTTATYNQGSWDFSANGATITISTMVKANGQVSGNKAQLGVLNTVANGLNNNGSVAFETFRVIPQSATTLSLHEQFRTAGALTENTLGTINTTVGDWYKFVVTLTNVSGAAGGYNAACAIYDYGANGITPGANVVTFPALMGHTNQTDITVAAMWPALRAFQNGGIDAWDNFLVYTPASPAVITLALTNTSAASGQTATFATLADGPGTITFAWYTNGVLASGATGANYTTPPVDGSYTNVMVVASNGNGSATNSAAISVFVPSLASVTNLPASSIQTTSATLNGQVLSTGGATPIVALFYGPADGGTNASAWSNSVALGSQSGIFSQNITGLAPNTAYQFTARAVNAVGTSWAIPSSGFTTLPITPASVTNLSATGVQTTSATLNGQVLATGNEAPSVTLYYGTTDGGTTPGAWSQSVSLGIQSGLYGQLVTGLTSNTTYFFTAEAVNSAGASWAVPSATFSTPSTNAPLPPSVAVLTQHNDNGRTGANLQETILTTNNVNTNQFGFLVARPVDDQVYAQPLVMTNVNIAGVGVHNLLIIASVRDSIYAYDADDATRTTPYWTDSFINPPNIVPPNNADESAIGACGGGYQDFSGYFGIVGTPVIDPVAGTMFVVVRTKEFGTNFVQRLHALDVATGLDRNNSPIIIGATFTGSGDGSVGGVVSFDPLRNNQRPALALVNGVVYISWSSHCDNGPYHGWVIGYNPTTLQQVAVFNDTPNGSEAGIWMSGQGPCADAAGNLYVSTGNGSVDATDYGEAFLKLSPTNSGTVMNVASYFIPLNWSTLNSGDVDLGTAGLLLIPGTTLTISGGKQSVLYLVDRDTMGGISGGMQSWSLNSGQIHGGPAWWTGPNGSFMYIWADNGGHLLQYQFSGSLFNTTASAQSSTAGGSGSPGGILSVSANGTNAGSGILWAVVNTANDANQAVVPGTLHAYNAQNVSSELWNSDMVPRDSLGNLAKFVPPTVANGKVYMATFSGKVNVYGLQASTSPAKLALSPTSLNFGSVITGQTNTRSFQVVNSGGLTLTGTVATTAPFRISGGTPFSLSSGQTGLVQVAFSPAGVGNFSNVVTFTSNGGNSTNAVTGSGVAPAQLAVSPASLSFGALTVGANAQLSFTVTNAGGVTLSNGVATVPSGPFTILSGTPFSLPAFSTTNLTIRFAPTNSGNFSNAVVITSSGGNSTNSVTGSAVAPAQLAVLPPSLSFGTLIVGANAQLSFTLTNTGGVTLSNGVATVSAGAFAILSGTPFTLPSLGTTNLTIRYAPTNPGNFSNQVVITSSGGNSTNVVTGSAVTPAQLAVAPPSLSFGTLTVGANAQLSFTLTNLGGTTLSNGVATVPGGAFTILSGTPFTLPSLGTTNLTIRYAPTNSGSFSNQVVITSSGGNSTNAVTGSAVTPAQLAVAPPSLSFGTLTVGANAQLSFTLTNLGGTTLSNGVATVPGGAFTILSGTPFTLPSLGTTNLTIRYAPTNSGNFSNLVVITSSGGNSTNAVTGSAVTPAQLTVSPPKLSFGTLTIGANAQLSFALTNLGGTTLSNGVATVQPGAFSIVSGTPFTLPALGTTNLTVRFAPTNSGSFSNVVIITSGGGNSTNAVTGSAVAPAQLSVSPVALNFGFVAVGANAQSNFAVTNLGGANLTNGVATAQGGPFTILSGTPFALPGFGATNLTVRFSPTNSGNFSNLVVITSDGGNSTNAVVGTGAAVPVADFTGSPTIGAWPLTVSFTDNSTGTITNRSWDFGDSTSTNTTVTAFTHSYAGIGTNSVVITVSGPVGTNKLTRAGYIVVTNLGPVTLVIQPSGNQLQLTWPAGTLQSAFIVTGPYTNITTATSPFTISPSNAAQFFRIKVR
jgi:PKD repeat protein